MRLDVFGSNRHSQRLLVLVAATAACFLALSSPLSAQADDGPEELFEEGVGVYSTRCAGCHQAGGVGVAGAIPPLVDNPRLDDDTYLKDTIVNGLTGPIEVAGVAYDGVMPAFPALSDKEIVGLVAVIRAGFEAPAASPESTTTTTPPTTTTQAVTEAGEGDLGTSPPIPLDTTSGLSGTVILLAFAIAVGAGFLVLSPRIFSRTSRLDMSWLDAWLRAVAIFLFFIVGTALVPSMVLKTTTVGRLDRLVQDAIGSGLWLGALSVGLVGLWWAHRENRI